MIINDTFATDLTLMEKVGSKMKNVEKIEILLDQKYTGSFDFAVSLFKGIQSDSCALNELKLVFEGKWSERETVWNML